MNSNFTAGRWGIAFKNGKLYEFTDRHVLVLTGGMDPRSWLKRRSHGWKATRKWADHLLCGRLPAAPPEEASAEVMDERLRRLPSGQFLLPGLDNPEGRSREAWIRAIVRREYAVLAAYQETIPEAIRTELVRYNNRRWHLYNLLVRCPGALDLSQGNPALAYMLASNWVFHKPAPSQPIRTARRLVNRKQKVILEWLGFPATETVRRTLAKIEPDALSVSFLCWLRHAVADPDRMKAIRHLSRINCHLPRLLMSRKMAPFMTPRFLEDVSQYDEIDGLAERQVGDLHSLLLDTLAMAENGLRPYCPPRFHSLARLLEVHEDLIRRGNARVLVRRMGESTGGRDDRHLEPFPAPPFAGTPVIRPIESPAELEREGLVMQNCVGFRKEWVERGECYVYRVLDPVRATLSVRWSGSRWELEEAELAGNLQLTRKQKNELFKTLCQSGEYVMVPEARRKDVPPWEEPGAGSVVTRGELNLEEGQRAPPEWNYRNPRQLPLLAPAERASLIKALKCFG